MAKKKIRFPRTKSTYGVRVLVPGPNKKLQKLRVGPRIAGNPAHIIAATAVEASSKSVLGNLGIKILDVSDKPDTVHTLGTMIAAKAIVMATKMGPKGRIGGVGGVLASIGASSIDVAVSPEGVVSASVVGPAKKSGGNVRKAGVRYHTHVFPCAPDGGGSGVVHEIKPVGSPTPKEKPTEKKKDVEVGETTIIKDEHGTTHIHIHSLNVYITADLVQQLNVNPQLVQNVLAEKLNGITAEVEKKVLTSEKDEEDEDDEKKKKKKVDGDD